MDDVNCAQVQFLAEKAAQKTVLPLSPTDSVTAKGKELRLRVHSEQSWAGHAAERCRRELPPLLHILPFSAKTEHSPVKLSRWCFLQHWNDTQWKWAKLTKCKQKQKWTKAKWTKIRSTLAKEHWGLLVKDTWKSLNGFIQSSGPKPRVYEEND